MLTILLLTLVIVEAVAIAVFLTERRFITQAGTIHVEETTEKKTYSLDLSIDAEDLDKYHRVIFDVDTSGLQGLRE